LRIIESTAACAYVRNRVYARRRAKSPRHWARMDKKYLKRFGQRLEPQAYLLGDTLVVHPILAPQYRAAINNAFPEYRA
jgi:hypothetical protein